MIVAVPVAERIEVHPLGGQDFYWDQIVWWHWECTDCGEESRPRALFSHASAALERGHNWHLANEQCDVVGQLALFPELLTQNG